MAKTVKTLSIISLLLVSMVIGIIPITKAANQDSFGYTITDSNTTGGPTYNWIEISNTGNPSTTNFWWGANENIGFSFSYYGRTYDQIWINNYGLLSFNQNFQFFNITFMSSQPIKNSPLIHGFVAPFWDNLYPRFDEQANDYVGSIFIQTIGEAPNRLFIVEWVDVRCSNWDNIMDAMPGAGITFEVILSESTNNILFQYKDTEFDGQYPSPVNSDGGTATVGIEDQSGITGLEYAYQQPIITDGMAVLFSYPTAVSDANVFVSINAPVAVNQGQTILYTVSYGNLGGTVAQDVSVQAHLDTSMLPFSSLTISNGGSYDPITGYITWDIGSVNGYPNCGTGSETISLEIPNNLDISSSIQTEATITTTSIESIYDDNQAIAETIVTGTSLPSTVQIQSTAFVNSDPTGTPIIRNMASTTFSYEDFLASAVDIKIHLSDGGPDIAGSMSGPAPTWTYTSTFGTRTGDAVATFTSHYAESTDIQVAAHIEIVRIDPSGYIYDRETLQRVSDAVVWLQMPNERGGWINVPTDVPDQDAVASPNINPQITGENGRYQWDTIAGTYRVHVEAPGYYPIDSIAVAVPPPVTDLDVGLVKIPLPEDNSSPVVNDIVCGSSTVMINTPIVVTSSFTDLDEFDVHTAVWTWSDGHTSKGAVIEKAGVGTVTGERAFSSAGVYTETLTLTVIDNNGGSGEFSKDVTIVVTDNAAPVVQQISCPLTPIPAHTPIVVSASFSDSSIYDTHIATWTWSDGYTTLGTITEKEGVGLVAGNRIFTSAGVYKETLTLTVTDDKGASGQSTVELYVVVYDPSAGFVTGGGTIDSPTGAYIAAPSFTGKANFAFVSQYKKGASIPTGNTEFDFHAANLKFHSTSYDWLVVGGAKAQYKGIGTINGVAGFGFMLTAIDGHLLGSKHVDTFRIKIWDISTGLVVYDNQIGSSDLGDPTTIVTGGSIIVHK